MDNKTIFNTRRDDEFFGRADEVEEIYRFATSAMKSFHGIFLTGRKWAGKTELLKRVYRRLFSEQNRIVPIYYRFKDTSGVKEFADDFLRDFVRQYIAFLKRKPEIMLEDVSASKLERLSADMGFADLSKFFLLHREAKKHGDHIAVLKNAISAPNQAVIHNNTPIFLMLDDFDLAANIHINEGDSGILREYMKTLTTGDVSFLITGYTKRLVEGEVSPGSVKVMELSGLDEETSAGLMMEMCKRYSLNYDSEILAVAARQLEGNPVYIKSIIAAAKREERDLLTIKDFVDVYVGELVEGSIGFSLSSGISIKTLNALRILHLCISSKSGVREEDLAEEMALDDHEKGNLIPTLRELYLVETDCGLIRWIGDRVTEDYINYLYETMVMSKSQAEAKARIIKERLKEGFCMQGVRVSAEIKKELLQLLEIFNGQLIPKILFRNQEFLTKYGGKTYGKVDDIDIKEDKKISLPQITGYFDNVKHGYGDKDIPIIIGYGFNNRRYDEENEVVWIVGLKESPVPFHTGDAEGFIRQCNAIVDFKTHNIMRWIVSREGFTGDALKRLAVEDIYTTDAVQFRILKNLIEESGNVDRFHGMRELSALQEYEIVLPVSAKAELVAAKAVEEIGVNMGLDSDTITQIKTALVEACINAFEHGKVKNSKVYCRIVASDDRIVLYIKNEGRDFDTSLQSNTGDVVKLVGSSRRGWGIELMKQLMDEVRFEKVHGGTRLVMVKYIKRKGEEEVYEQES